MEFQELTYLAGTQLLRFHGINISSFLKVIISLDQSLIVQIHVAGKHDF